MVDFVESGKEMIRVAVIGGDKRQVVLASQLKNQGFTVGSLALLGGLDDYQLGDQVDFVILPSPGLDKAGNVTPNLSAQAVSLSESWVAGLSPQTVILVGMAPDYLVDWCRRSRIRLVAYMNNEPYQIANAVPTAEGALCLTMVESAKTIAGSRSVVFGLGRCGLALALRLKALGSLVSVVARKPKDRALGQSMGLEMVAYDDLARVLARADLIYNTVPSLVLGAEVLALVSGAALIIDLASAPGGCDFEAAEILGVKAILASNLPGRYFPESAGLILAHTLSEIIHGCHSLSANLEMGGC